MLRTFTKNKAKELYKALSYLTRNHQRAVTLSELSSATDLPKTKLNRIFRAHCQVTPIQWSWNFRVQLAKEVIKHRPDMELHLVAKLCGFTSLAHFSRRFHALTGIRPIRFRQKCRRQPASSAKQGTLRVRSDVPKRQLTQLKRAALTSLMAKGPQNL